MSIVSGNRAAAGVVKDALGRGPGVSRGLSDRSGSDRYGGFKKKLKKGEVADTASGTTGDPDNPTLDELRGGLGEPVYDRFVEGGRRRKRTVMSLGGDIGDLKRFLGG